MQLGKLEVDTTRELSQVKIHIERIIEMIWHKFTILQSTMPIAIIKMRRFQASTKLLLFVAHYVIIANQWYYLIKFVNL